MTDTIVPPHFGAASTTDARRSAGRRSRRAPPRRSGPGSLPPPTRSAAAIAKTATSPDPAWGKAYAGRSALCDRSRQRQSPVVKERGDGRRKLLSVFGLALRCRAAIALRGAGRVTGTMIRAGPDGIKLVPDLPHPPDDLGMPGQPERDGEIPCHDGQQHRRQKPPAAREQLLAAQRGIGDPVANLDRAASRAA